MAHAIGGMLHILHGKINAMLLPLIIEHNACHALHARMRYLEMRRHYGHPGRHAGATLRALIGSIRDMNHHFGIPATLQALGKDRTAVESLRQALIASDFRDGCTQNQSLPAPRR